MIILYLLNSLFLGLMIISFIMGDASTGFVFLGIVGIITIIGITINFLKYKANENKTVHNPFKFISKVNNLKSNPNERQEFTMIEIASSMVNLMDARRNLTSEEYYYVCKLYETFENMNGTMHLDLYEYMGTCNAIISWFDFVAPYYKFCGNREMEVFKILEDEKEPYRIRARKLLNKSSFDDNEFKALQNEFNDKFHDNIT